MASINHCNDQRESQFTPTTQEKWPDRHPRSKQWNCTACGEEARLYACGARCDEHSPAAMREAVAP